jgi:O-antigen/teichoic acid export membrane protein
VADEHPATMMPKRKQGFTRLGSNTFILLMGNGMGAVLSFVLTILIGRGWGEAGLGYYGTVLAWIYPLSLLVEMGIGTYLTRQIAQQSQHTQAMLRKALHIRFLLGGIIMLLVMLVAFNTDDAIAYGVIISAPLLLINPLYSTFTAVMRGHEKMHPIAIMNVAMLGAQVFLTWFLSVQGYPLAWLLAVNTLTSLGQMLIALLWVRATYATQEHIPSAQMIRYDTMLKESFAFAIASVLAAIQSRGILLILQIHGGNIAVGLYVAAWRWLEAGRLLPMAFFDALYPRLSALVQNPIALRALFSKANQWLVLYALVFAGGMSVSAGMLITVAFGDSFSPAIDLLQILAWGMLPLVMRQVYTLYWYAWGAEKQANIATLLTILVQFSMGWFMIEVWQAQGAVYAFILGEILLAGYLISRRSRVAGVR